MKKLILKEFSRDFLALGAEGICYFLEDEKATPRRSMLFFPLESARLSSPRPRLEQEITAAHLETQTSLHESFEALPLPVQRVDNIVARLDQGSLEHVREQGEDRVEGLEGNLLLGRDVLDARVAGRQGTVGDTRHQLGQDGQIKDEGRSQKRVLP